MFHAKSSCFLICVTSYYWPSLFICCYLYFVPCIDIGTFVLSYIYIGTFLISVSVDNNWHTESLFSCLCCILSLSPYLLSVSFWGSFHSFPFSLSAQGTRGDGSRSSPSPSPRKTVPRDTAICHGCDT